MENHLIITLIILASALVLFLTNRLSADLVALLVVVTLGVTGVLTTQEAFSGFSRAAVITIISIYVLTEGLQQTGVTDMAGTILLKVGGKSETRMIATVMAAGAFLSLFMNNIAAAAVLLPAVSGAARRLSISKSQLLMPLAFSTILGGMATLLTTSNIILNSLLRDSGLPSFRIIDFIPVGSVAVLVGMLYMIFVGRKLLPRDTTLLERTQSTSQGDLIEAYHLGHNLFRARLPEN